LQNESNLKLYILRSCCPEEEWHSQYKLIVYYYMILEWIHCWLNQHQTASFLVFFFARIRSLQGPIKSKEQAWWLIQACW
jgi:hypothetical protein